MDFTIPTSRAQLYSTLSDIFHFYRVSKTEYKAPALTELFVPRMECEELTEEQLLERAKELVSSEHAREIFKRKNELNAKIKALEIERASIEDASRNNAEKIQELYEQSQLKLNKKAVGNGLVNSSVYLDKTAYLESEMNGKILALNEQTALKIAKIDGEIAYCNEQLLSVEDYFKSVHEKDVLVKSFEIKDKLSQVAREVLKYNNGLEERRHKVKNDIKKTNANLELRYLEVKVAEPSKSELVEMGYYADVAKCITGYYNTLEPAEAFMQLSEDTTCAIYLEDNYQNVVYMYGIRAGVFS